MQPTNTKIDRLQCRAILYAGISSVFAAPADEKFQFLRRNEFRNGLLDAAAGNDEYFSNGSGTVHRAVVALLDAFNKEKNTLEYEYINIFGHTLAKKTSPYELEHLQNQEIFYKTQSLADISGFYNAFGLRMNAHERVDFISVEAEFLSYLIMKELIARQKSFDSEKIEVANKAQHDFFKDHFAGWTQTFARNVIEQTHISFYQCAGRLLQRFIDSEMDYFGIDSCR
jgi:TorA maturation chaperone TorD